jgi:hypothetical protein
MITRNRRGQEQEKPSAQASSQFGVPAYTDNGLEHAARLFGEVEQSFGLGGGFKRSAESRAMIAAIEVQKSLLEAQAALRAYTVRRDDLGITNAERLLAAIHLRDGYL